VEVTVKAPLAEVLTAAGVDASVVLGGVVSAGGGGDGEG
jgi:hypothetical protein